jgi:hypothetical protein
MVEAAATTLCLRPPGLAGNALVPPRREATVRPIDYRLSQKATGVEKQILQERRDVMSMEIVKFAVCPSGYLIGQAIDAAVKSFTTEAKSDSVTTAALKEEAIRQDIETHVLQGKARIEQELAIARRIDNAEDVEIEEYYDSSGKGALGLEASEGSLALGVSGTGRRITKRVYKFKGFRPLTVSEDIQDGAEQAPST